jgi:hypothetical protein
LLNDNGKPVGDGVSATININGVFYTRISDASGYVKMNINLNPGTYIATIQYNGLMMSNTVKVLSILKGHDISMKYRDGTKYEVQLLDSQGNPYSGEDVTFNIKYLHYKYQRTIIFNVFLDFFRFPLFFLLNIDKFHPYQKQFSRILFL